MILARIILRLFWCRFPVSDDSIVHGFSLLSGLFAYQKIGDVALVKVFWVTVYIRAGNHSRLLWMNDKGSPKRDSQLNKVSMQAEARGFVTMDDVHSVNDCLYSNCDIECIRDALEIISKLPAHKGDKKISRAIRLIIMRCKE